MTLYARSDVMSVALSKEHGGCGATHTRPVTHGAPAKVWALECVPCEDHLRSDPHWAVDALEVPETPDEKRLREKSEEKKEHTQQANMEKAVASLAATTEGLGQLMAMMVAGNPGMAEQMSKAFAAMASSANQAEEPLNEIAGLNTLNLAAMKLGELRALAKERGLDSTGTRDDLLKRLQA